MEQSKPRKLDEWSHIEKALTTQFGRDVGLFMAMLRSSQLKPHLLVEAYRDKTFISWSMAYGEHIVDSKFGSMSQASEAHEAWAWLFDFMIQPSRRA